MTKLAMSTCCLVMIAWCSACASKPPVIAGASMVRINRANPPLIGFEYYPEASRRAHEQGICIVTLTVLADGTVTVVHVTKSTGYPALDSASMSAFRTGTLLPATKNGVPIDDTVDLPVTWSIRQVN